MTDYKAIIEHYMNRGFRIAWVDDVPSSLEVIRGTLKGNVDLERPEVPSLRLATEITLREHKPIWEYLAGIPHSAYLSTSSEKFMSDVRRQADRLDVLVIDLQLKEQLGQAAGLPHLEDGQVIARRVKEFFAQSGYERPCTYFFSGKEDNELRELAKESGIEGGFSKLRYSNPLDIWTQGEMVKKILYDILERTHEVELKERQKKLEENLKRLRR